MIPHCEAAIPRPTWASPTSINTQDSFSSRWPGDYSPSVPTPPPSSADLLPKLYLDRWHSSTALNWPGVFPSTLLTCGCRWPPPLPFYLSFPALLTCPPPALLSHLCLQHWQNYSCDSSRLTQRTLANVSIPLLYVATEALPTPSGNSWSVGSIWTGRTCPHPQASLPADIFFHGSIRRRHSHSRKSRTDSRPVLICPHFYHKSSRLVCEEWERSSGDIKLPP